MSRLLTVMHGSVELPLSSSGIPRGYQSAACGVGNASSTVNALTLIRAIITYDNTTNSRPREEF